MASGDLKLSTVWDLGSLGASEGPPIVCHWIGRNLLVRWLSWLALLGVLLALLPFLVLLRGRGRRRQPGGDSRGHRWRREDEELPG